MAEGKGPLLRENSDISRLITNHAINNGTDSNRNTLHAYEVALKSKRDQCVRQGEQVRQLQEDLRRQLADKAALHAEIELLRERASQQRRQAGREREQAGLQARQLLTARRRLEQAGLDTADLGPPSLEQANRGSDELHVQPAMVQGHSGDDDVSSMTEEEIARRLLKLQQDGRQSLEDSFNDVVSGLRKVAEIDTSAASPASNGPANLLQTIRQRNKALRETVTILQKLKDRGTAVSPGPGSLPPLQEIPLSPGPVPVTDRATDPPSGHWPVSVCPLCGAQFGPPTTRAEFEDHVYAHMVDMTVEEASHDTVQSVDRS